MKGEEYEDATRELVQLGRLCLHDLVQQSLVSSECLDTARDNLAWWQDEAESARVSQLSCEGKLSVSLLVGIVVAASGRLIDCLAGRSSRVFCTINALKALGKCLCKALMLLVVGW